jgi:coiled-coil domain-containing protein 130
MSSLAAARADNFYYPPEWTPKQGSLNKFQKSHPLGKRAAKIDQGILVIRFEMPCNAWCDGCKNHISRGVRYNAEKRKVGNYFTTTIWEFKMKCHLCDTFFVLRTDPKNTDYVFESGIRKKVESTLTACAALSCVGAV